MRYDTETIEKVRNANDIVDVIGRHVRLTKKGANYFGLCPFHGEKTASFSVNQRKQFFHCFGCGVGGSVIDFVMQYENMSFQEAVRALADNAHIELPESTGSSEDRQANAFRQRLLEVNKEAAIYYNKVLRSPDGRIGLEYFLDKRKLRPETITHFGLGFASKTSDALYKHLKEKGYDDELLSKSGLVTFSEKGIRDKFWNRVMFPIMDTNNRVIGFGGRVMGDGEPKYLNSPETFIFDKSSQLYGLNFARKTRQKYLLLCEGYMDVIALHQAGFTNAVASLGTAFTDKHARLLKRYTDNVILTQDSDKAGIKAKIRAFPILYEAGLNVKVLDTGKYKDPDEFIKAEGAEGYERCISKARNAFLFVISVLKDSFNLSDPAEKTDFVRETVDRLCIFKEPMERDNYIDAVSREFMLDRDELKRMTDRKMENGGSYVYRDMPAPRSGNLRQQALGLAPGNTDDASAYPGDRTVSGLPSGSNHHTAGNANVSGRGFAGGSANVSGSDFAGGSSDFDGEEALDMGDGIDLAALYGEGSSDLAPGTGSSSNYNNQAGTRNVNGALGNGVSAGSDAGSGTAPGSSRNSESGNYDSREFNDTSTASYEMLLISWLTERPDLCSAVFEYIKPEEFNLSSCRLLAKAIEKHKDNFEPAAFLDDDGLTDVERRAAATMFAEPEHSGSILNMNKAEIEKGLTEAIRAIRKVHIDREMSKCGNDIVRFQNLLKAQNGLREFAVKLPD